MASCVKVELEDKGQARVWFCGSRPDALSLRVHTTVFQLLATHVISRSHKHIMAGPPSRALHTVDVTATNIQWACTVAFLERQTWLTCVAASAV